MSQPFVGEIRMFAGDFAPVDWAFCNGQLLRIADHETLFNLIGFTYGGDGQETYAVPNLCGRVPIHRGAGRPFATSGGSEAITLSNLQVPPHTHAVLATSQPANAGAPAGKAPAAVIGTTRLYATDTAAAAQMSAHAVATVGGNLPHENRMPFLAVNFIIALEGIFPSSV